MKIPERFQRKGMTAEEKKRLEAWIKSKREIMSKTPTFEAQEEAVQAAVKASKKDQYSFPSVWKEPEDIGDNFAVVHTQDKENAYISGYNQVVDEQKIFDLANGRGTDEIEEVD